MILMYLGISITKNIILLIDYFYPIQSTLTLEGNILYFKDYLFLQIKQLNLDQQLHLLKILKSIPYYDLLQSSTMVEIKEYVDNLIQTYERLENNIYPLLKDYINTQNKLTESKIDIMIKYMVKVIKIMLYNIYK